MKRRTFLQSGFAAAVASPLLAALKRERLDQAAEVLAKATANGVVTSAALHVRQGEAAFSRHFGDAKSNDAMFLLGSISKPICVTALMTLFDRKEFALEDRVTMKHLLTHVSGLPDQLPENNELRKNHSPLSEFVERAIRTPLGFPPGSKFSYSSMAILLATHVAEKITGVNILDLVEHTVFRPLQMKHSAQGLGQFKWEDFVPCQTEFGAPEAGAGDPAAKDWNWNSPYWRKLGVPWGGTHCSAPDVGKFLAEFLNERGAVVKAETARLMVTNQNPDGFTPWGLGLSLSPSLRSPGCSEKTFGHTGSTGTIAWADPTSKTICVVLTSLPARAMKPHPRDLAAAQVAKSAE
jgi:CubicO group peptidase (beta-lactamase class C family)